MAMAVQVEWAMAARRKARFCYSAHNIATRVSRVTAQRYHCSVFRFFVGLSWELYNQQKLKRALEQWQLRRKTKPLITPAPRWVSAPENTHLGQQITVITMVQSIKRHNFLYTRSITHCMCVTTSSCNWGAGEQLNRVKLLAPLECVTVIVMPRDNIACWSIKLAKFKFRQYKITAFIWHFA